MPLKIGKNETNTHTLISDNVVDEETRRTRHFLFCPLIVVIISKIQTFKSLSYKSDSLKVCIRTKRDFCSELKPE